MSRRFQFSLRALMAAMLAASSFFAGVAFNRKEANAIRNALKVERESNAKLAEQFRDAVKQLHTIFTTTKRAWKLSGLSLGRERVRIKGKQVFLNPFRCCTGVSMAFTVGRSDGGSKDAEFEDYARLLRQRGVDLGRLPRAPEPGTGRRWLYVWSSREEAEAFADELKKRTADQAWAAVEVSAPPSEGPMGPIIVQVGRRASGLVFALHPLSRMTIQSAFPAASGGAATVSINFETVQDFVNTHGSIEDLAREVVPTLTGLTSPELERLGYALIEDDTDRTLVFVRPGDLVQA